MEAAPRSAARSLAEGIAGRDNNFNLIRLVAAIAVVFGHSFVLSRAGAGWHEPVLSALAFDYSGSLAVYSFFFISGIFVTQSWCNSPNAATFVLHRVVRIWPALIVCLLLSAYVFAAISTKQPLASYYRSSEPLDYVRVNAVLNQLQWSIPGAFAGAANPGINGSLWSLPIEVRLYAMLLAAGLLGLVTDKPWLAAIAAALAIVYGSDRSLFLRLGENPDNVRPVLFFMAGMAAYALRAVIRPKFQHLAVLAVLFFATTGMTRQVLFYVLFALAIVHIGCNTRLASVLKVRNDYSYGTYLYGWPVQQLVAERFPSLTPYPHFLLSLAGALVFATFSWHVIERPSLRRMRTTWPKGLPWPGADLGRRFRSAIDKHIARRPVVAASLLAAIVVPIVVVAWLDATHDISGMPIVAFGPNPVTHAQAFNVQPTGTSAIWVLFDAQISRDAYAVLGTTRLRSVVNGKLLTAEVPLPVTASAGNLPLWVERKVEGGAQRTRPVSFEVR